MADTAEAHIQKLLSDLWRRSLPQVLERLAILEQAASAASIAPLPSIVQRDATSVAHKFSGSLGMFGFPEGTRLARELEQELGADMPHPPLLAELTSQLRRTLFPSA